MDDYLQEKEDKAKDSADRALETARRYFAEGTPAAATTAAILAVAEQLAALNETMARFHEFFVMSR